jgi:hypothetical protein
MIWAIPTRILREILLVIVGAEDGFFSESRKLPDHWRATGRLPVDIAVDSPVDHNEVR